MLRGRRGSAVLRLRGAAADEARQPARHGGRSRDTMNDVTLNEREAVLAGLADSVWKLDAAMATEFANRAVAIGMDAYEAINDGLAKGMMVVSGKFDRREYFVPELLRAAKAMNT